MLGIVWRAAARKDLVKIIQYIAAENPAAARKLKERIETAILPTSEHPYIYPASDRMPGLREIVAHPNYLVFYKVTPSRIEVVNIVHSRRSFP